MRSNQDKGTLSLSTESGTKKIQNVWKFTTNIINKKMESFYSKLIWMNIKNKSNLNWI